MKRLVSRTFPITSEGHEIEIKCLNTRQFKTFIITAQQFAKSQGADVFDKLVELLDTVIVEFKDDYTDEDDNSLDTVESILWALEMNTLNDICKDVIQAVKLGESEVKNLNSSQAQHTAESVGNVETAVDKEKELVSNIPEKTGR